MTRDFDVAIANECFFTADLYVIIQISQEIHRIYENDSLQSEYRSIIIIIWNLFRLRFIFEYGSKPNELVFVMVLLSHPNDNMKKFSFLSPPHIVQRQPILILVISLPVLHDRK